MSDSLNPIFNFANIACNVNNKKITRKKLVRAEEEEIYVAVISKQITTPTVKNFEETIEKQYISQNSYQGTQDKRKRTVKKTRKIKSRIEEHLQKIINLVNDSEINILDKTKSNILNCLA